MPRKDTSIDLILVNSFAPRHRIASDAALENGLAIIRTYLEDRDFIVYVADEQRVSAVEDGVPTWLLTVLRWVVQLQGNPLVSRFKSLTLLVMLLAWPLQSITLAYRQKHMDKIIDNLATLVTTDHIPFVGIKVWGGAPYAWSKRLSAKIRALSPETTVIAGGPHVKVYGENMLAQGEFDLAIMGPGEEVLEELLKLRKTVPTKVEFMALVRHTFGPSPLIRTGHYSESGDYYAHTFIIPRYRPADMADKVWFHTLVDGLGCTWNKCAFCSHTRQSIHYTPRPLEEIKAEILAMTSRGIAFFRFSSSETPLAHGKAIAQMVLANGLKINYSMFARPAKVSKSTYEAYRLMIRSGLRAVFLGGETGHDVINDKIMHKGVVRKDIIDTIHCIKLAAEAEKQSCQVVLSMIYPCPVVPGVTLEDVFDANVRLFKEANPDTVIVNPPGVFPGTTWFDKPEEFGFTLSENYVYEWMNYEYSVSKPVEFWSTVNYKLNGMDMKEMLKELGRLNREITAMGIPINISDDYLMMSQAIGYNSQNDLFDFKKNSFVDILSGTSPFIKKITQRMNERSVDLAKSNYNQTDTASKQG
ncbi:B12-binding domain-containing radical SAM protein [Propionispora hippei]|uniref:Radical SAM superfamily protein n=1 Tax=Propionispora hippei DSM 15287 TaxID=1123003 RepID=A0A1M6HEM1_9FIRM|nr:radical SAM protein [Propionispora hippei]SHJ20594.1 Radical SAM superfamily protein [Propionispora hippei DSM 15287]